MFGIQSIRSELYNCENTAPWYFRHTRGHGSTHMTAVTGMTREMFLSSQLALSFHVLSPLELLSRCSLDQLAAASCEVATVSVHT